jgi:hypothetical protein
MFAVGVDFGRTSQAELDASLARLQEAQAGLPVDSPTITSEPVMGEYLYGKLLAYYNQTYASTEVTARNLRVRFFTDLSTGFAIQEHILGYAFGTPISNEGGGLVYDIVAALRDAASLQNQPADLIAFRESAGTIGSAHEHALWQQDGADAISAVRLLQVALEQGVDVYQIDASNRAQVLPLLTVDSGTMQAVTALLDAGRVVRIPARNLTVGSWQGIGYVAINPETGNSSDIIRGAIYSQEHTLRGGSVVNAILKLAAYALLVYSMMTGVAALVSAIVALLAAGTVLAVVGALALIGMALWGLSADIAILKALKEGALSSSRYILDTLVAMLVAKGLAKLVGVALKGVADSTPAVCPVGLVTTQGGCASDSTLRNIFGPYWDKLAGFLNRGELNLLSKVSNQSEAAERLILIEEKWGADRARGILNHPYYLEKGATGKVIAAVANAPSAPNQVVLVTNVANPNIGNFGWAYEFVEAGSASKRGLSLAGYDVQSPIRYQPLIMTNGQPVPYGAQINTFSEADLLFTNSLGVDAKYFPGKVPWDIRILNEMAKAQAGIKPPSGFNAIYSQFEFRAVGGFDARYGPWVSANAPNVTLVGNLGNGF